MESKQLILTVRKNKCTGDLYIKLPNKLLKKLKWKTGDNIDWSLQRDGTYILSKINEK